MPQLDFLELTFAPFFGTAKSRAPSRKRLNRVYQKPR